MGTKFTRRVVYTEQNIHIGLYSKQDKMKYSGVTLFCSFILATTLCFAQTRSPCPSENRGVCISEFQVWNKGAGKTQAFVELYFQSGMEVYDYVLRFVSVDRDKLDMTLIGTNQRSSQYVVINSTNQFFEAKNKQPVAIIILSRIHKDDVLDGVVCSDKLSSGTHILKDRFGIGSVMVGDGIFSFSRCGEHFEQTIPTWGKENSCSRDHYVHEVDDDEEYDVPENDDDATAPVLHIHSTSRPSTKVPKSTRKIIPSTKGRATLKRSTQGVTPKPTTNRMTSKPTTNRMTSKPTTNRMTSKPTTNRMTSKPTTNRMTSKPTIKSTTPKPTTNRMTSKPTTNRMTSKPTTNRMTSKPTTNRMTSKPTTNRMTSKPTTNRMTSKPTTNRMTSKPTTNRMTSKPTTNRMTSKPTIKSTTPKPTTNRMTSKPTTNRMTSKPTTNRMTSKPTTNRMTSKPTTNRMTSKPTTNRMTSKPTTNRMTSKPTTNRMTSKPTTNRMTSKPTTNRMTSKPTTNRMTSKPTTNRMTSKPTIKSTTPKPTTNRMTSKPTTNRMTSKPTIKSTTHKLTTRSTKIEIKTKKTTAKPTTDNTKTPSTRKPKTTQGITTAGQSTHQKTTHKISTQTSKKPTAAQMSSSKPTSMIPSSETTSNTKHTTNQVTKTSLNPPTSSTANQPTSSPQPASKPVTPTKHISMRTSPGQTASAKSSAAPITTSPGSGISSSIYRSSTTISLSSSSESRSNPTGSGSKTTNSGFSPSGSHSRLMTTESSSPPSRAASTTTGPNPLNLFINEVNILLENGINNTFIELQGPHHMTLVNYSIVVFDGQSKATLFHRRFVDADTFTGSGFFVVRDYMSNGNKESVVVALFDNTRWTQHYQHHVPVTESQGLIDSFVVRTTNDQLNSELLENMVPTHGNRIVTIDPRLLAHRPPVSMSRCLKITLDPGSFLLAPPTMGQPNNCTLEGGHRVQFKLTDAKCRDFKNPKLQDELVDYIVNGINKLCMCGMTQALVTDRKYLCGSLVFESFMRATMPWQSDEIFKNYRTFVARSSTAVVGSQRYHTDSSCYRDCLPPPVNPNSNHGDNVTLTVAVVVSCVGAFLIVVIGVVIYIKRKRTGIVTFRLTNLGEMDTSNMLHDDKDDFVDDDTATFKSISLVTT